MVTYKYFLIIIENNFVLIFAILPKTSEQSNYKVILRVSFLPLSENRTHDEI